ncbi:hypothetical protein HHK36_002348 [Tetracentron sinense]|uniref:Uncharacterized protein n=1 Tax=Tetracentron sinense TaxID=13715 RepID=A0A834ZQ55_TETSI|nr:hypothetical protein HHK36_002348 [Tetracentron sinense]
MNESPTPDPKPQSPRPQVIPRIPPLEMLRCFTLRSPSSTATATNLPSSPSRLPATNSREGTPRSSAQPSPTVNLIREYTLAVQTKSYNELWSKIQVHQEQVQHPEVEHLEVEVEEGVKSPQLLGQVLHPNRESVQEGLRRARPNTLTRLVSAYFDNSEQTSHHLCLLLHHSVHRARSLYDPLQDLLDILPLDPSSLTHSQCEWAFNVFLQFDRLNNPFPHPDSGNFDDMCLCFSQLRQQLDLRLNKSSGRIHILRRSTTCSALCLIGTAVGVTISAMAIAAHALVALVGVSFFAFLPTNFTKKELQHVAQLDAAAKGTFVLNNELKTIDRLVARLHGAIESDKLLIRLGLERGSDRYPIHEVLKQLRKNYHNIRHQLDDLEEHICLCFVTVNRARSRLLQEIQSNPLPLFLLCIGVSYKERWKCGG